MILKNRLFRILMVVFVTSVLSVVQVAANGRLKVFIEGDVIDFDFLRSKVTFVDFVNDSYSSDIHIIVNKKSTGSGGGHYYLTFSPVTIKSMDELMLNCVTLSQDTQEEVRLKFKNTVITGLLVFINEKQLDYPVIVVDSLSGSSEQSTLGDVSDPWDNWVFNIGLSGGFDSEEQKQNYEYESSLEANRVTEMLRVRNEYSFAREESFISKYKDSIKEVHHAYNQEQEFESRIAYSLSSHWSAGINLEGNQTTYRNIRFNASVRPAIEYNFFPWQQVHRRIFTVAYYIGPSYFDYYEKTIPGKTSELLWTHNLKVDFEKIEKWGEMEIWLEAGHFFPGLDHYAFEVGTDLSVRVVKGLFIDFGFEMKKINNQLYLSAEELSDEELLLNVRKLPTSFEYSGNFGIRFQFGSVYNNVVNQRL